MAALHDITCVCPICGAVFLSWASDVDKCPLARQTDFHPVLSDAYPLSSYAHSCPDCGFTAIQFYYEHPADVDTSPLALSTIQNLVADREVKLLPVSERVELAARIGEALQFPPEVNAFSWLVASWAADEERDIEAVRYYRLKAVNAYTSLWFNDTALRPQLRVAVTFLIGELWRRIGDDEMALEWFQQVEAEENQAPGDDRFKLYAKRQQMQPTQWMT